MANRGGLGRGRGRGSGSILAPKTSDEEHFEPIAGTSSQTEPQNLIYKLNPSRRDCMPPYAAKSVIGHVMFCVTYVEFLHTMGHAPNQKKLEGYRKPMSFIRSYYLNLGVNVNGHETNPKEKDHMKNVKAHKILTKFTVMDKYLDLKDTSKLASSIAIDSTADQVMQYTARRIIELKKTNKEARSIIIGPPEKVVPELWKLLWSDCLPRQFRNQWTCWNREQFLKLPTYPLECYKHVRDASDSNRLKSLKEILNRKNFRDLQTRKAKARGIEEDEEEMAEEVAIQALSLQHMQLEQHMLVYSRKVDAREFSRDMTMNLSHLLNSPVYQVPVMVSEMISAVLLNNGGNRIYDCVSALIQNNETKLPFTGDDSVFHDGRFIFNLEFWNLYLRSECAMQFDLSNGPTQSHGVFAWKTHMTTIRDFDIHIDGPVAEPSVKLDEMASGNYAIKERLFRTVVNAERNAFPFCTIMWFSWLSTLTDEEQSKKVMSFYDGFIGCNEDEVVFKFINDTYTILSSYLIRGNALLRNSNVSKIYEALKLNMIQAMARVTDRDNQFHRPYANVPTAADSDFIQMLQSNFPWQFSNQLDVLEDDDDDFNYSFNGISNTIHPLSEFNKQKRRALLNDPDESEEEKSDYEDANAREEKKKEESYEKFVRLAVSSKRCRTAGASTAETSIDSINESIEDAVEIAHSESIQSESLHNERMQQNKITLHDLDIAVASSLNTANAGPDQDITIAISSGNVSINSALLPSTLAPKAASGKRKRLVEWENRGTKRQKIARERALVKYFMAGTDLTQLSAREWSICTFDCIGGTVHNNDARQTRSSVLQYINCLYCSRKIYNTCDLELKNFIRNEASEFVAVEGRLQIPLQTRRKYKCETCRATDRQKRVDLRCRSFALLPYYTKRGKSSSKQDIINIIENGITLNGEDLLEGFNPFNGSHPCKSATS